MEKGFPEWLALDPDKITSTASAATNAEDEAKKEMEDEQAQEDYE